MKNNQDRPKNVNKSHLRQKLLLVLCVVSMIPLFFAAKIVFTAFAQTKDKKEKKLTKEVFKNEPIEFIEIKSNGKAVKLNEKFTQEEDWLNDFTIKFKNVSGKSIVYVSTLITFSETNSTGQEMGHSIKYGVHPLVPPPINAKPELLAPNDTAELRLSAESFSVLKNFLATRQHSLKDLSETHLTIMAVYFDDGTHWSAGSVFRPDPNRPGKFIAVEDNKQEKEK